MQEFFYCIIHADAENNSQIAKKDIEILERIVYNDITA